ncbi:bifunctional oligoribonuclease/PAP phosphatase NrnA [Halobacillus fulvus]|nr:bifunctional oligoribonuclease/PAP phosphatase NrnA [Halobacillus fulvus]
MCKQTIIEKIEQYTTVIVHRHVRPDPDAYGSQVGLAEIIRVNFPEKKVFVTGEEDPSLDFLAQMDEVPDEAYKEALVIVCDTANQARIDDQRYSHGEYLIKIDHHPVVDSYGDTEWVDTTASSTSEMIYELFLEMKDKQLSDQSAGLLYAGIVGDTGRFLFPSTTKKTLSYAADLVQYEFDRRTLYSEMYKTPVHVAKLKGYVLQNFTVHESGYSTVRLTKDILEKFNVTAKESSALVGLLGDVEGVLAWVFYVEEESSIRVRLRSRGPVINKIAENHNGGGHPLASGATASNWEETDDITKELEQVCSDYKNKQTE